MRLLSYILILSVSFVFPAMADMPRINTFEEFMAYVNGKSITRPLIELQVTPDGRIAGRGAKWPVNGRWSWKDGYFCRDLNWGGDELGYNCQEVRAKGNRIRFTSDRGQGQTATFRLN